ncbi:MAG: ATP-binding protein [Chitinispirillales bacterium]|jgi:AAA+ superfamily predicted ATPase|nr:ATP-binding protein [Chitinispirillales bacterium]
MTNSKLLSRYTFLVAGYLKNEITAQEFAQNYDLINEEVKNCGEFLTLPYLKQYLNLKETEYMVLIIAAVYEINGVLPNINAPTFAHALSIISEIYTIDHNIFELFRKESPFSKLWRLAEHTPLISAPLALKREALLFITCGDNSQILPPPFLLDNDEPAGKLLYKSDFAISAEMFHGEEIKEQIKILCCYAANKNEVFKRFGLDKQIYYGNGTAALFHGPSGTGKTMAAHIVADTLGLPLMKVGLSDVFNKYIGETEKHIKEIFDAAQNTAAVLLFDEADALFSKRTEITTSHDKYANLSTSFLLQKIEEYDGVTLLTSNLSANLDEAFLRRMQFVIRFSLLPEDERKLYWKELLGGSAQGICEEDLAKLAEKELSPARIKEIVKMAAVLAFYEKNETIATKHVNMAMKLEFEKSGRKGG